MNWNYVATFTGMGSIADLPAGALDESGTLWVMWGDAGRNQALTCFSQSLPQNGKSVPVSPSQPSNRATTGPPCLISVHGHLVTLWTDVGSDGNLLWGILDSPTRLTTIAGVANHLPDGALAAFFPGLDHLFVAMTGPKNEDYHLKSTTITGLDKPVPHNSPSAKPFATSNVPPGQDPCRSRYAPAVAAMPDGRVAVLWRGMGGPDAADSDNKLYFMSAPDPLHPVFPFTGALQYPGPGGSSATATSLSRPSLALHGTGPAATLVAVYPGSGRLSYLVGTLNGGGVTWAAPPQNGTSDGTVPLADLLANAGADKGAVKLTNPVGVWVTAPGSSNTLYLLVGDQADGKITGPLYLVRYGGASH